MFLLVSYVNLTKASVFLSLPMFSVCGCFPHFLFIKTGGWKHEMLKQKFGSVCSALKLSSPSLLFLMHRVMAAMLGNQTESGG